MRETLQEKYPKLFIGYTPEDFACEDGWAVLLDELCAALDSLLSESDARMFRIVQVKQKYGQLAFYVRIDPEVARREEMLSVVAAVRAKSLETCEICGASGRLDQWRPGSGFWQTLCLHHGTQETTQHTSQRA